MQFKLRGYEGGDEFGAGRRGFSLESDAGRMKVPYSAAVPAPRIPRVRKSQRKNHPLQAHHPMSLSHNFP